MKYYSISSSTDPTVIGTYPQLSGVYPIPIDHPDFIDQKYKLYDEVKTDVSIPLARLRNRRSKLTDFPSCVGVGFGARPLVSDTLKKCIEHTEIDGIQFLPTRIMDHKGIEHPYWLMNPLRLHMDCIDYDRSEIWGKNTEGTKLERVLPGSRSDIVDIPHAHKMHIVRVGKFVFNEEMISLDMFVIANPSPEFFVSERLKVLIEEKGCTGIVFNDPQLLLVAS
jgi:hypothetical protein